MTDIRVLTENEHEGFLQLQQDAYPGIGLNVARDRDKLLERMKRRLEDRRVTLYGAYRGKKLAGVMRIHDYTMNLRGTLVPCGGLGGVAVHLEEKRQRVAGDLVRFYLDHYRGRKFPMAVLWPFRPDFYRKMGFGFGGKKYRYEFSPEVLPNIGDKSRVRHLTVDDIPLLKACYDRLHRKINGLLDEIEQTWKAHFKGERPSRIVGFFDADELKGFLVYSFNKGQAGNFLSNDIDVEMCFHESPEALLGMLTFLHSQRDQIRTVIFNSPDPDFLHCVSDPRNGSERLIAPIYHEGAACGVGIMYRVLMPEVLFENLEDNSFGANTITVSFVLRDEFYQDGNRTFTVRFDNGVTAIDNDARPDVTIGMSVADFSALVIGSIPLTKLFDYGLAEVSDLDMVAAVDDLFATVTPPYCITAF